MCGVQSHAAPPSDDDASVQPPALTLDGEKLQGFNFRNSYRTGGYYDHWALRSGTRLHLALTTGNSESIACGGLEKLLAKKQRVTNLLMGGASYAKSNLVNDGGRDRRVLNNAKRADYFTGITLGMSAATMYRW